MKIPCPKCHKPTQLLELFNNKYMIICDCGFRHQVSDKVSKEIWSDIMAKKYPDLAKF